MTFPKNHLEQLWAPWRVEYFERASTQSANFLLDAAQAQNDADYLVVKRGRSSFLIMNGYPYATGHLMVAPYREVPTMDALTEQEIVELWKLCIHGQRLLRKVVKAESFNIGINLGEAAGAGLPQHLHLHIVPRWEGDSNFMTVIGQTRILPEALQRTYENLLSVQQELEGQEEHGANSISL